MSQVADSTVCHNCRSPLTGPYCAACGQKAQALDPSAHDMLHDVTHEMLHVDGRIFRTVQRLLLSPGFLTREYFEGRRVRWISPLRLYLIFSVVYFAVTAFGGSPFKATVTAKTDRDAAEALQKIGFSSEAELQEVVSHARATWAPRVMFLLVPLFAWFVHLVSRRFHRNYPQHLLFALHLHAAWFAAGAIAAIAAQVPGQIVGAIVGVVATLYGIVYLVLAFRRAYSMTLGAALGRAAIVGLAYFVAVMLALMAILLPAVFWHRA